MELNLDQQIQQEIDRLFRNTDRRMELIEKLILMGRKWAFRNVHVDTKVEPKLNTILEHIKVYRETMRDLGLARKMTVTKYQAMVGRLDMLENSAKQLLARTNQGSFIPIKDIRLFQQVYQKRYVTRMSIQLALATVDVEEGDADAKKLRDITIIADNMIRILRSDIGKFDRVDKDLAWLEKKLSEPVRPKKC